MGRKPLESTIAISETEGVDAFVTLALSLGLGLLIGLQRERIASRLGGIRTFPLFSLLGTICGLLATTYGGWMIATGFLVTFGVLAVFNFIEARSAEVEPGQTTEVAALLTFAVGAYLVEGDRAVAVITGGLIVVLLHAKGPMHAFVQSMGKQDIGAIMQFVVISMIILPLLPDREFGPLQVLNPFDIWRMVVLIVGISLAGYIVYKLLGSRTGTWLGGILGGVISSTATTVSYARRAREAAEAHNPAVIAILIASTVAFVRIILELAVVASTRLPEMVLPIAAMLLWMALVAVASFLLSQGMGKDIPPSKNPAELKSALVFGAIYALVLLAVALAKRYFGSQGLYVVALLSGLTDMDAITLSIAHMVEGNRVDATTGWRLILAASLANLVFKGTLAGFLGGRRFGLRLGVFFAVALAGGILIIFLWPPHWSLQAVPFTPEGPHQQPAPVPH